MGLLKDYICQTRKPEGFLGKLMLSGMNSGHAKLADWGMGHLPPLSPARAADLGHGDVRVHTCAEVRKLCEDAGLVPEAVEHRRGLRLHCVARKPV